MSEQTKNLVKGKKVTIIIPEDIDMIGLSTVRISKEVKDDTTNIERTYLHEYVKLKDIDTENTVFEYLPNIFEYEKENVNDEK